MTDVPRQAQEAERAVLGAVLMDGIKALDRARDCGLTEAHFYAPSHGLVYAVCERLAAKGQPVDYRTVLASMSADEQRRSVRLDELVTEASFVAYVERHAKAIVDAAVLRRLSQAARKIEQYSASAPLDESRAALELARAELDRVEVPEETDSAQPLTAFVPDVLDEIEQGRKHGLSTGLWELDDLLGGGPAEGQVMVIGARPSEGKTMLGANIARAAARRGDPCAFFSLEMTRHEITQRFLAMESGVALKRIRDGQVGEDGWVKLAKATDAIRSWPLIVDDSSTMTMADIRARLRKVARKAKPKMVVVDYLQLVQPTDVRLPREQQVAGVSKAVKALAKDFACPVVMLAQLSRETEKRRGARPVMSDLRESGSIENDADIVVLLYPRDGMDLLVVKNRQGERGEVAVEWQPSVMRVRDRAARAESEARWQARLLDEVG